MLENGKAYKCYCTQEELKQMREQAEKEKRPSLYDRRWRDREEKDAPDGIAPVIRLKAPINGITTIDDKVLGEVSVDNSQIDDMILLRADGSPTYMLAVVVDDYDMGVTHIIRGEEHFINAFRQAQIYAAMGWPIPTTAHIPLILGTDGKKLSKREGAVSVEQYKERGLLREAFLNYILRLGWSRGDEEIISLENAVRWFDFDGLGKSPAKADETKLLFLNAHYIKNKSSREILGLIKEDLEKAVDTNIDTETELRLITILPAIQERSKILPDIIRMAKVYCTKDLQSFDEGILDLITSDQIEHAQKIANDLQDLSDWSIKSIELFIKNWAESKGLKLKDVAQPLRILVTGSRISPGLFEVIHALGKEWTMHRIMSAS
ncbi:glutamate--tRNA ligase 2 [Candidatus Hydrogenosomobacter endosymbioticus]|uniref:Glutamate--tRNA ligase 2 n=2 Tax=Candidatus Hydrogenosomobacter endosymbioticus TaxID=2558174 RepID=A0ABM7V9Q2_9PROT|nr:glutamate--tRNA ligase 2 [Candidatus Hydrogenosomobacter endosymbioticus]